MIDWIKINKIISTFLAALLIAGTFCIISLNNTTPAKHTQNTNSGIIITCSDSAHDNETPCPSSTNHKLVEANISNSKKGVLAKKKTNSPALPSFSKVNIFNVKHLSVDEPPLQQIPQQKRVWFTVLPRSHLG